MEGGLKSVYDRLPVAVQDWMLTGYSAWLHRKRYGGRFPEYRALFEESQGWARDRIERYQDERLVEVVGHAYRTVPYYRETFDRIGLRPEDVRGRSDLAKIPILTRETIKSRWNDLVSREFDPAKIVRGHTSGTTGSPLEIGYDDAVVWATYAALDRQYRWAGVRLERGGDRVALFRGNVIVPLDRRRPPFWRHNRFHNHLLLSSFHMSAENLDEYFKALDRFRPDVVDGYPSNLYVLAKYLRDRGRTFPVRAALTSSETLYDFQRELIEEAFECRVFDYFGLAERVVFAVECDRHDGHHLCDEYGITEIVDEDGVPVPEGRHGVMVATSLHNRAMPMIRYRTNDSTAIRGGTCACGRALARMDAVATKAEDILTLPDGRVLSPSALTHPFKPLNSIQESQIVQTARERIVVRVVPRSDFTDAHRRSLIEGLQERIGAGTTIEVELVDRLERSRAGKFKWVVSHVDLGI